MYNLETKLISNFTTDKPMKYIFKHKTDLVLIG